MWDAADRRTSSLVLYPEARAAVARARRLERLSQRNYGRVRRRLEALWAVLDRVAVTPEVMRHAGALAETRALRAYDAVHLASAVAVADAELVFVASDGDLLAAARAHGLATSALG